MSSFHCVDYGYCDTCKEEVDLIDMPHSFDSICTHKCSKCYNDAYSIGWKYINNTQLERINNECMKEFSFGLSDMPHTFN